MEPNSPYFRIYLQDHHASLEGAIALSERIVHELGGEAPPFLPRLLKSLREEMEVLEQVMDSHGVASQPVKDAAARIGERLARLKLNGKLPMTGRSPLSGLVEFEGLALLLEHKLQLWRSLHLVGVEHPSFDFEGLVEAAVAQRAELQPLLDEAAGAALSA